MIDATSRTFGKSPESTRLSTMRGGSSARAIPPYIMTRTSAAKAVAMRLDIDLCHCSHDNKAERDERDNRDERVPERPWLEEHADVVATHCQQAEGHEDRKRAEHIRAHSLRSGKGPDIPFDPDPLPDGFGDRVEHLRETPADLVLDIDRCDDEL